MGAETCVLICVGITALVCTIIFATMWHSVEPTEYGMSYNSITKTINMEHVYDGGLYFLGFFKHFIKFPRTIVNIEFSDLGSRVGNPAIET